MHFTSFLEEGRLTVALTGEIDHHRAKEYIRTIAAKIEAYAPRICILDFQEVSFIDSSGIAVVINAMRNMMQLEGKLLLTEEQVCKMVNSSIDATFLSADDKQTLRERIFS